MKLLFTTKMVKTIILMIVLKCVISISGYTQELTIRGVVTDDSDEPLPGASVMIRGTMAGTITDADGKYSLKITSADKLLVFSYMGFETQEIAVNGRFSINVTLVEDAQQLREVVVTALNVKRSQKELGYIVEKVRGSELAENKTVNVISSLSGKIAGLDVGNTANGVAGSKRVTIRGISSITGNNQPLWIVDGIPINSNILGDAKPNSSGGIDFGDGLSGINADDIEEVTVLKGASAAALYGSRASNGVILVTTKSGGDIDKKFQVDYSSSFTIDKVIDYTDWQYEYGQGLEGEKPTSQQEALLAWNAGWGAPMDGSMVVQFDGKERPYLPAKDNVKNFYKDGYTWSNTLALAGRSENHNFRLSASKLKNNDIVPNSTYDKTGLLARSESYWGKLTVSAVLNFIEEKAENRQRIGGNGRNVNWSIFQLGTNIDVRDMKPGYLHSGEELAINNGGYPTNPYFVTNKMHQEDARRRFMSSVEIKYDLTDWLYVRGRALNDYYSFNESDYTPAGIRSFPVGGGVNVDVINNKESNYEFTLGSLVRVEKDLNFRGFVGGNIYKNVFEGVNINGSPLAIDGVYTVNNLVNRYPSTSYYQKQTNSVFGSAAVSYRNTLFLDVTGRKDWFSTLPLKNNSLFYPSLSLSYIFSNSFSLPTWISSGKIRGSVAQVSGDTDPYQLNLTYALDQNLYNEMTLQKIANSTIPNKDLQPLLSSEFEVGTDFFFLDNALEINFTYYDRISTQDIVSSKISNASGYNQAILNVGKISNNGIEAAVNTMITKGDFEWDITAVFSSNKNKVLDLGNGLTNIQIMSAKSGGASINVVKGQPYGVIKGFKYQTNDQGAIIYGGNGYPLVSSTTEILGHSMYDKNAGLSNNLRWKNFSFNVLIDAKFGAQIFSEKNELAWLNGKSKETLVGREKGIIGVGVTESGAPNESLVPAENLKDYYWQAGRVTNNFVYDASFVKLREVSLGFNFPKPILTKLKLTNASLSLIGRNLWTIYKRTPNMDPESNSISGNAQGIAALVFPPSRNIGINLNVSF